MGLRQGVPYDFSIVTRGKFVVIDVKDIDGDISWLHPKLPVNIAKAAEIAKKTGSDVAQELAKLEKVGNTCDQCFSVQINPDQIEITDRPGGEIGFRSAGALENSMEAPDCVFRKRDGKSDASTLLLTLKFDVFDEYKITSSDGLLPVKCDLINDEDCALNRLRRLAGSTDKLVYFAWGPIEWVGFIQEVETDFTCFSRWGEPLKATARVRIVQPYFGTADDGYPLKVKDLRISLLRTTVKGFSTAATIAQRVVLGASQALR